MNPKRAVCEGNVDWVNLAQTGSNWHRYVECLFHLQGPNKVLLVRWAIFTCSVITFTFIQIVHFLPIQMDDTHKYMQPANLASAA